MGGPLVVGLLRGHFGSLLPQSRILDTQLGQLLPLPGELNNQPRQDDDRKNQPEFGRYHNLSPYA